MVLSRLRIRMEAQRSPQSAGIPQGPIAETGQTSRLVCGGQTPSVLSTRWSGLWYVEGAGMKRASNILAAVLALVTLVPNAFGRPNVICVESSGRTSSGCEDVLPDDMVARIAVPPHIGLALQGCGFCHDFNVGNAVSHSFQDLALPTPVIDPVQVVPSRVVENFQDVLRPIALLDSSGGISLLKC